MTELKLSVGSLLLGYKFTILNCFCQIFTAIHSTKLTNYTRTYLKIVAIETERIVTIISYKPHDQVKHVLISENEHQVIYLSVIITCSHSFMWINGICHWLKVEI